MPTKVINVAKDFSRYPVGRFVADGPYSGEKFRNQFLLPALSASGSMVVVELDGARGYGSSFLEEAFGGLVRAGLTGKDILARVRLETSDKSLEEEIRGYIADAEQAKQAQ
jgi:hypothetical protein